MTEEEKHDPNKWLLPYGNLMTILMVFFLILYAFTYWVGDVNYEKLLADLQSEFVKIDLKKILEMKRKEREALMAVDLSKKFEKMGLDRFADVSIDAQMVRISLASPVLFPLGEAYLREESKMILKTIAEAIRDMPNKVIIEGHTCDLPIYGKYKSNWELSIARAVNVINYFVTQENIPPDRFIAAGYGEYKPISPNDTELNRSKNRRIEIVIIRAA